MNSLFISILFFNNFLFIDKYLTNMFTWPKYQLILIIWKNAVIGGNKIRDVIRRI